MQNINDLLKNISIQNYHKHTDDTNPIIMDSAMTYEMLAKKTIENGGKILSSVAHGWQGRYHYAWEIAQQYGLKFIYGTEAYWVKNRKEEDKTNAHIIILAKTKKGMQDINEILSIANEDGYYYKPRIDLELIFKLNKEDIFITSACIGGAKYDDIEDIWVKMYEHFEDSFMLEIQNHNTQPQIELNKKILDLHKKYGIKMIVGLDTHIVNKDDYIDRNDLLLSKGIKYHEEESDWILHYQTNEEIYDNFIKQNVFTSKEIIEAMENTNVILEFEDIQFDKNMKLPTIYPDKTQEEKDKMFKDIINKEFVHFMKTNNIPKEKKDDYLKAVRDEAQIILNTGMADYFLLNYEIIKKGKEYGGIITPSGRGCFKENSLILTNNGLQKIKNIKTNEKVLTKDGKFEKVINTFEYDIEEDMVEIIPQYSEINNDIFNNVCTLDHEILISRDNKIEFKKAIEILSTDNLLIPKIKINNSSVNNVIDLNEFNNTFKYDDEFIYNEDNKKIKRFIENNYKFNLFIGSIYSYGKFYNDSNIIELSISKNIFKKIEDLIKNFNGKVEIKKEIIFVEINSVLLRNFLYNQLNFENPKERNYNIDYLLNLNTEQLNGLLIGLMGGDKYKRKETKFKKIVNLIKIIGLMTNNYFNINFSKKAYIKRNNKMKKCSTIYVLQKINNIKQDEQYFYLGIEKIKIRKNQKTKVYDLQVENEPSYTIHNMIVHNSAGSFLLNTLFGFSSMDRLIAPVKLYPERFLTEDRVNSGSLVDIDFNVSKASPFIKAQKDVMGENHAYPMLAFGKVKPKSAFKMYCRSQNLDFQIANEISKQIDKYEKAFAYASDDERDDINIYDFIDKEYHHYIEGSQHYLGIIADKKIAPCSHILYSKNDIRREIGIMRLQNKATKEDVMCACIEGFVADKFGFLKNDL